MSEGDQIGIGGLIFWIVVVAAAVYYMLVMMRAAQEFDVWVPTKEQRRLVADRDDVRKDWSALYDAVEMAERLKMEQDTIDSLKEAKDNAKLAWDIADDAIATERARIADTSGWKALVKRWSYGNSK